MSALELPYRCLNPQFTPLLKRTACNRKPSNSQGPLCKLWIFVSQSIRKWLGVLHDSQLRREIRFKQRMRYPRVHLKMETAFRLTTARSFRRVGLIRITLTVLAQCPQAYREFGEDISECRHRSPSDQRHKSYEQCEDRRSPD